jgi:hypothetical protein
MALMSFLANFEPIIGAARAKGYRVTLFAHSMGNLALESGVVNWSLHGNAAAILFDQPISRPVTSGTMPLIFRFPPAQRSGATERARGDLLQPC